MIRKSFIASALVALVGLAAAAPAMANDVRIEQYGWSNSAGGAQEGYGNRIRTYQNGGYNRIVGHQYGRHNLSAVGQEGKTITAPPIRTAAATWPASASSVPTTPPSSRRTATATSRPVSR